MARSEGRLLADAWEDPEFIALPGAAQRLYMFLLSQRDLAHDGVIALRIPRWARKAAGLTASDIEKDIAILAETRFVVADDETGELLVRSLLRRDKVYRQPNVLLSAADHLALVESDQIRAALADELRRIAVLDDIPNGAVETLTRMLVALGIQDVKPMAKPTDNPIGKATEKGSRKGSAKGSGNPSGEGSHKGSGKASEQSPGERGVVTVVTTDSPVPLSPIPGSPDPGSPDPSTQVASLPSSATRAAEPRNGGHESPMTLSSRRRWSPGPANGFPTWTAAGKPKSSSTTGEPRPVTRRSWTGLRRGATGC